ncbi:hypothetical protein PLICRDRAFT_352904 [Plicaturopsis crispa FD-325 SS-3]|uniref:Carboxylic ester hydrolase n=1 Tax=Plicaturopsis crispa FD-325 SS-3 TaxID=944288 RepID=A0A0C9SXR7_PLICR|nr:hypothetical protein PLICRDRAFT_352904 [Plicaturopsis crispa FD-325 SS-3]
MRYALLSLGLILLRDIGHARRTEDALSTTARSDGLPLDPTVDLGYARYAGNATSPAGIVDGPVTFYGGIPYAKPPLGDLRFRASQQLNESIPNGGSPSVIDARDWGPPCIQQPAAVGVGSEDCLTLNVWKPTNATAGDDLPVVVYIYGGGFYYGTTQGFPMYDWVMQNSNAVIAVSVSYRLNLLGFLSGTTVASDGDLNVGLLDQRAALWWIQRHIRQFGGDPDAVTIVGESAGGASVVMQTVAYGGTQGAPFKRAIAQSIGFGPTPSAAQSEATFKNVTSIVGCPSTGPETMSCLRNASIGAIVSAINHVAAGALSPVVDGVFLPALPSRLIASGNFTPADFIGGHCTNDGRTFVGGTPEQFVTDDDVAVRVFGRWPGVSNATIDNALALYPAPGTPGSPFASQYDRAWTMAQEIIFGCMDWYLADRMLYKGVKNVFGYRWNAADPVLLAASPYMGVMHTSDLYYLFDGTKYVRHTGYMYKIRLTSIFSTAPNAGATFTPFNTVRCTVVLA